MIVAGRLASGQSVLVRITEHAVSRSCERVKPHLGASEASAELAALVDICLVREGPPRWLRSPQRSLFHLDAGTIMLAIDPDPSDPTRLMARTVLTTGCFSRQPRRQLQRGNEVRGSRRTGRVAG